MKKEIKISRLIGLAAFLSMALTFLILSFMTYDSMGGIGALIVIYPCVFFVVLGIILAIWALTKNKNKKEP